jgi:hypothetical protein
VREQDVRRRRRAPRSRRTGWGAPRCRAGAGFSSRCLSVSSSGDGW